MTSGSMDSDQDASNRKLAQALKVFQLLGTDCEKNISIILEQTCAVLDTPFSFYYQIDENDQSLVFSSGCNIPDELKILAGDKDYICKKATIKNPAAPTVLDQLDDTPFYRSDPRIKKLKAKAYLGVPVLIGKKPAGILCVFDTGKRTFCAADLCVIQSFAAALGLEEEKQLEDWQYKLLVESSNDAIYVIQDGHFKFCNPKAIEMSGCDARQIYELPFSDLVHPKDRALLIEYYYRRLRGEKFQSTYNFRIINKKQQTIWVQINAVRIHWQGKPAVLGYLRDISSFRELETKLKRAEKMELVGTMAGGVAHDLNNILSGLVSYPELLLMQLPKDSPLKDPISFMHNAGMKAADIVQDLLTLTRRNIRTKNTIDLNTLLHDYFNSPGHQRLKKNYPGIRFSSAPDPDLLNIRGSGSHLSKIIMNLVINAAEAIKDEGQVHIKTHNRYIDLPLSGYDTIEEGDYVVLSVSDTGDGIANEDLNRIFEPFYTKKQMGRSGSGLGLSVVWNCVKDHHGYIEITSSQENGTVFDLFFPATRDNDGQVPENFDIDAFTGDGQSILIIDDVEEQRQIASDSLKLLGYNPFVVSSGEKAIDFIKDHKVDLLLLDMKMEPGIDGYETYTQILKYHPDQKAVITSGFSVNDRVRKTLETGAGQYIQKPFTLNNLARAIKKELTGT